jgi:predicted N-acetyltransferase YhbS
MSMRFERHAAPPAQEHWRALEGDAELARCSLWWQGTPALDGAALGVIGHFAAAPGARAGLLLEHACAELARHGARLAVGPMDGSTWRSYRLVSDAGTEPPFFLEPWNPIEWNAHFAAAGFAPLATYHSSVTDARGYDDARVPQAAARLRDEGVRLRTLDPARFLEELERIHELSLASFAHNFLYTPVGRDEFVAQYRPIERVLDPRLVLMAECGGELAGFLFALPDALEAQRGAAPRSVVLKTMAVRPGRRFAGLGAWLAAECHARAAAAGFTRVVHALMHDANVSAATSRRRARLLRRYALYARALEAS